MHSNNIGMTEFYNRFHDPSLKEPVCIEARELQVELDNSFLGLYGWPTISQSQYGFAPEYVEFGDNCDSDAGAIQELLGGNVFFKDAGEAVEFEQRWKMLTGTDASLPWRYRWPDTVRDDVLARLLALNAERYEEEKRLGLHSQGAKKTCGAKKGRKAKATEGPQSTFQLEPEPLQIGLDFSRGA